MADPLLHRVPVVAGVAYLERVQRLPAWCRVALQPEADNRYFLTAIAVIAKGEKVGYVAPEISRRYYSGIKAHAAAVSCQARRGSRIDHQASGVELLLDFSDLPVEPVP